MRSRYSSWRYESSLSSEDFKTSRRRTSLSVADQYVLICGLGSILFGYNISCFNTCKSELSLEFNWCKGNNVVQCKEADLHFERLTVTVFLTATLGAFFGGILSNFGRKFVLQLVHISFIVGSCLMTISQDNATLYVGRAFCGFAVGLVTVGSPMFISEICPVNVRGSRGVIHQLCITVGILIGIGSGLGFTLNSPQNDAMVIAKRQSKYLRFVLFFPGIVSLVVLVLLWRCYSYDTPHYLVQTRRSNVAIQLLRQIYERYDVDNEFHDIANASEAMRKTELSDGNYGLRLILTDKWYRHAVVVGAVLAMGQQIVGVNTFVSGSNAIFEALGTETNKLSRISTLMALVNALMTFPAIHAVESFGRKPLLIFGNLGQAICLSTYPVCYFMGFSEYLSVVGPLAVVGFMMFFAFAFGPVLWVYLHEVFPPEIQCAGCGFTSALNWLSALIVVSLDISYSGGRYLLSKFIIFSSLSLLMSLFCLLFVKETKNRTNANSPFLEGRPVERLWTSRRYSTPEMRLPSPSFHQQYLRLLRPN